MLCYRKRINDHHPTITVVYQRIIIIKLNICIHNRVSYSEGEPPSENPKNALEAIPDSQKVKI